MLAPVRARPNPVWKEYLEHYDKQNKKRRKIELDATIVRQRWEEFATRTIIRGVDAGHIIVAKIHACFEQFERDGTSRSPEQAQLHEQFLSASARYIYKKAIFEQNEVNIMEVGSIRARR